MHTVKSDKHVSASMHTLQLVAAYSLCLVGWSRGLVLYEATRHRWDTTQNQRLSVNYSFISVFIWTLVRNSNQCQLLLMQSHLPKLKFGCVPEVDLQ